MTVDSNDLPEIIGKPALRALSAAGIKTLKQVSRLSNKELLALHGVGPKAIDILRRAVKEQH